MRLGRRDFLKYASAAVVVAGSQYLRVGGSRALIPIEGGPPTGLTGLALDALSGLPVAGVVISVPAIGATATSDIDGAYRLELPEGQWDVIAAGDGYVEMSQMGQSISAGQVVTLDFVLVRSNLSDSEQEILYERLVASRGLRIQSGDLALAPDAQGSSVSVPEDIVVRTASGDVRMNLDEYLKGVVPCEVPASWPAEALKAQAVAARSYAITYVNAHGYICTTTACQAWSSTHYASTDAAVQATSGVVAVYNGQIISANFFSRCNGVTTRDSEHAINWQTCGELGWNAVPYLRARACGGHGPYASSPCGYYGHGVGLCQWGVKARADEGMGYQDILERYYSNIYLVGPGPTPSPTPSPTSGPVPGGPTNLSPQNGAQILAGPQIVLTWSGQGTDWYGEFWPSGGPSGWRSVGSSGRSWNLGAIGPGTYFWHVKERNGSGEGAWSATLSFQILQPRRSYIPRVAR